MPSKIPIRSTIDRLQESLDLSSRQIFQATDYIDRSMTILAALCGLCLIICISAYLGNVLAFLLLREFSDLPKMLCRTTKAPH